MRRSALAVGAVCWMASVGWAQVLCPRADRPPTIDGRLDDAAWTAALKQTDFTRPRSDRPPGKAIEAKLCFDRQALYLAVVCAEPKPGRMKARATVEDDNVWQDDCVEVWVRTTPSALEFDQFIVNTLGTRQSVRRRQRRVEKPWRPTWQPKVRIERSRWVVEMRIPFSDLDVPEPKAGDMFQLKIGREDHTDPNVALATWPPGSPYAGTEGYATVYFERDNLLANADMSRRAGGKVAGWSFHKGDAGLFESLVEGQRGVIAFSAPGRYTTAAQSLRLKPDRRYRIDAKVKGTAGIYLRARTAPKAGEKTIPYTALVKPSADYRTVRVPFPTGPDGRALILIGNTEGGGKGLVHVADLRVVQEASFDAFGPAIPVKADSPEPTVIRKLAVADCRALRGFAGTCVDGTTRSGDWSGHTWEYNQPGAGAGVGYSYRGNDGLHVSLAEDGGFHAVLIRGGARVKMLGDCAGYDKPESGKLLADFPGRTSRSRAWFDRAVTARRVSFFDLEDGRLADVSFFHVRRGGVGLAGPKRLRIAGPCEPTAPVRPWIEKRFAAANRQSFALRPDAAKAPPIRAEKGRTFHLLVEPLATETPLAAIGLDFRVTDAPTPVPITLAVQDPLNPKSQLFGADVVLSKPGRGRVVMDFPDQVVPAGTALWVSVTFGVAATVGDVSVAPYVVPREQAIPQALAYRKLLLKTYFASLSEARPWNNWYDDPRRDKSLADPRWGPQLKELLETLEQCKRLGPKDDLVRQYDEWIWRRYRPRRRITPPYKPRIDEVRGAPTWAVVARQAWLTARLVPKWWIENRCVPTGEFGGVVGDDTDMYQNYADFPLFERDGVGAMVLDAAERLAELAERENLVQGLNRYTTDPLHAYEEGVNHEALLAWWNYGDPVYLERCIVAARSTEALTVVTPKGHRHFKSQECGAADLRMNRKTDVDGDAHPLMWHPTFEVAWYNRNPRAIRHLRQWADGWLEHMRPGKYATRVDVASERVVGTTDRPLYGGYGGQGSAFSFLYGVTGDEKYLAPFFEQYRQGRDKTSPDELLPELLHRHGLRFLGDKLADLVRGRGAAETLVTGNKQPLIDRLKKDIAELQQFPAMYTTTEPFTDRVFLYAIRTAAIAYTGGYASRNKYHHTHAVSWEGLGTDYAALVLRARPDALKVLVYNFADRPLSGRMRLWTLDHGRYRLRVGTDANGDDRMDRPGRTETLELVRASPVRLKLPAKQVTVVELQQIARLDDERLRADLALSRREVRIEGGRVRGVAHNIGSRKVDSFEVALLDEKGTVRARKRLGPLAAPLDLTVKRMAFTLEAPPAGAKGWSVAIDPDNRVAEVYEGNNRVPLPAP